jgi:hypothetical protein
MFDYIKALDDKIMPNRNAPPSTSSSQHNRMHAPPSTSSSQHNRMHASSTSSATPTQYDDVIDLADGLMSDDSEEYY